MERSLSERSEEADPYRLDTAGIKEPPEGWRDSLRYLGPGLILSASIVGSGELIATTTAGAQAGFVLLWLVLFSCVVKVAVQIEFARWTIATGTPALSGYNRVPPRVGRLGWINVLFAIMVVSKILQIGGIVGGTAVAMSILLPLGGDPLADPSRAIWHGIVLHTSRYQLIERGAIALVVTFSVMTVMIAFGLPFTPWGYSVADLSSGLTFHLPPAALGAAIAMFGITGVGADEITMYNYWCIEKGYARWVGPNDGSEAWVRRARGWTRVMYKDALLSMAVYTFATVAFFLMGAAVLNRQGLVPRGNEMIVTLARMYTDSLGAWAMWGFLVGAVAVLGSTLWASVPSHSRMYANWLSTVGVFDWGDARARLRWVRGFGIALPIIWGGSSLLLQQPVLMVQIGGVMTGVFLLAVLVATWYLRHTETDPRLHGGRFATTMLVLSTLAIGALGIYTALSTMGVLTIG
jgi:Mn2+/Fe2+ NRAMP family transporter